MKALILPLLAFAALAACDGGTQGADEAAAPTETAAPEPTATRSPAAGAIPAGIPSEFRGRWGLVPADCEPGRADAKGLLTITAGKLEFYESVGTLDDIDEASANRIRASFDFTGEGMSWERDVSLELADGGAALVRREYGEDAAPEPFRYTRCD